MVLNSTKLSYVRLVFWFPCERQRISKWTEILPHGHRTKDLVYGRNASLNGMQSFQGIDGCINDFQNVLSSCTCEVTTANRFTCLSQNNDMEIPVNQAMPSVSDLAQSRHDVSAVERPKHPIVL